MSMEEESNISIKFGNGIPVFGRSHSQPPGIRALMEVFGKITFSNFETLVDTSNFDYEDLNELEDPLEIARLFHKKMIRNPINSEMYLKFFIQVLLHGVEQHFLEDVIFTLIECCLDAMKAHPLPDNTDEIEADTEEHREFLEWMGSLKVLCELTKHSLPIPEITKILDSLEYQSFKEHHVEAAILIFTIVQEGDGIEDKLEDFIDAFQLKKDDLPKTTRFLMDNFNQFHNDHRGKTKDNRDRVKHLYSKILKILSKNIVEDYIWFGQDLSEKVHSIKFL